MAKICSRAEQVIILLRPSHELFNSNEVITIFEQYCSLVSDKLSRLSKKVATFDEQEVLRCYDMPVLNKTQWFPVFYFYHRGWFRCMWTLREAVLAATTRKICGPRQFELISAISFAVFLRRSGWYKHVNDLWHGTSIGGEDFSLTF